MPCDFTHLISYVKKSTGYILITFLFFFVLTAPLKVSAATLLEDDFTGTTIDTSKWTEIDAAGAGGTSGKIQQNGTLTIADSFVSSTWGAVALESANTFDADGLEISVDMTRASDQLLGYGDRNFQSVGTKAYILDLVAGSPLTLVWNNGTLVGNSSCGSYTAGATYKMELIDAGGFRVYKDDVLACTQNTAVVIDDETIFLQSATSASTFDNVLVEGSGVATEPDAPTSLNAVSGISEVALSWTAPSNNGGSSITDYLVEYKLSADVSWTTFSDGTSTSTSATVTGLTNNQAYNFRVSAINAIGTGSASSTANSTPHPPQEPDAPTGLSGTPSSTQVGLSWTVPADNGGSSITDYIIEYKLNSEPTVWTTFADGTSTGTSTTVTGLTNDLSYNFRVKAVNSIGTGAASDIISATPVLIGVVFSDDFTGTTIDTNKWVEVDPGGIGGTTGSVQQNGTLSIANGYVGGEWATTGMYTAESYPGEQLEISAEMTANSSQLIGYGDFDFQDPANQSYLLYKTGGTIWALSWTDGNYSSNTSCGTYSAGANYRMNIIEDGFEIYINDVLQCSHDAGFSITEGNAFMMVETTASTFDNFEIYGFSYPDTEPSAPTSLNAVGENGQVALTWSAPSDGGSPITDYIIEYKLSSSGTWLTFSDGTSTSTSATVTGLTNNSAYDFRVKAVNSIGTSVASSTDSATPAPIPTADAVNDDNISTLAVNRQVLLNWEAPADNGHSISDYIIQYKLSTAGTWTTYSDGTSTATKGYVAGLVNGSAYNFRIAAVNGGGTGTYSDPVTATPAAITNLHFVITGESNSGGIGLNSDATSGEIASRSSVQIMNLTSGNFEFENLDIGTNNLRDHDGLGSYYDTSHGFELQLANSTEAYAFPNITQVYLTKTGQGGSQVGQWNVGGAYWNKFLERIEEGEPQLPANRQTVVWLSLGINDSIAGVPTNTWKTAMVAHINKIKAELPNSIIVMTQFQSMSAGSGYPAYNAVMSEIAAEESFVYVVDSTGAGLRDGNHWNYAGLKSVTNSMVTVTKNQLGLIYPGTPTSLSATPGSDDVDLTWVAPASNGGQSITDYLIEYKLSADSTWTIFPDGSSTSTSVTVTGLDDSSDYNFRVSAVNSNGYGSSATTSSTTTDGTAPTISFVEADPSNTGADITWNTNEQSSTRLEYGLTTSYGTTTIETDTSPRVTSHTISLGGLVSCTTYNYRVKSTDASTNQGVSSNNTFTTNGCLGNSNVNTSNAANISTSTGGTVELLTSGKGVSLDIPAGFSSTDATFQINKLDKTSVVNTAAVPTNFLIVGTYVYELKSLEDVSTNITEFDENIELTISYSDSDMNDFEESSLKIYTWNGSEWEALSDCAVNTSANTVTCTTPHFSVFALMGNEAEDSDDNDDDDDNNKNECRDDSPDSAPNLKSATAVGSSSIRLDFDKAKGDVEYYEMKFGTKSGEYKWGAITIGDEDTRSYTIKNLAPYTTYYFRVRAGNGCAAGDWSEEISARTQSVVAVNTLEITNTELKTTEKPSVPEQKPVVKDTTVTTTPTEDPNITVSTSSVRVKVVDTDGNAIGGASVVITGANKSANTNQDGIASFENIPNGSYQLQIESDGYKGEQGIVLSDNAESHEYTITVKRSGLSTTTIAIIAAVGILSVGGFLFYRSRR